MCATCGCGHTSHRFIHGQSASPTTTTRIPLEMDLLAKNARVAEQVRAQLDARGVTAVNLIGSPGAGKTTLLEATIARIDRRVVVLEGDQETDLDAERIGKTGSAVLQINTGTVCHLDAEMIAGAVDRLDGALAAGSLLFIENVGNLVCPALFDVGERAKVVVMSVTEGEDKPLKYPHVFLAARALVLTKTDLVPHLDFDVRACIANARRTNPELEVFTLSAKTGAGLDAWCAWLQSVATDAPGVRR